jgi:hypothetical protein
MVARESTNAVTRLTKNLIVRLLAALCLGVIVAVASDKTRADEGGVSMWLPGQFGSLVAVPTTPGWSLGAIYYHVSADEGASNLFPRGGRGHGRGGCEGATSYSSSRLARSRARCSEGRPRSVWEALLGA